MNKGGCSLNCKIVPAEFLHLVAKYTLPFSNPVKSDHNLNFWYFQNNHIKTTKIFSVRSSPDPPIFKKIAVRSSPDPCSPLTASIFSTDFSMPLIGFRLRATEPERKSVLKMPRYYVSTNPRQCMWQVSGNTLQQVKNFKNLGVVFTSDWRPSEEIDTWIGKANAVLRELHDSVVTKRVFSNTVNCQFSNHSLFRSLPMFMNLGYDRKNINSGASTKDGIFEKSPRCDKGAYRG